jgi:hypothetical protein
MDNLKQLLIPITLILLFYRPVPVYSAVFDAPEFRVFTQDSNGNWKTVRGANGNISIQSGNLGNSVTQVSRLPIPASNGKTYSVDVSRTATVDLLKVGSALGSLARKLTPLGMAVGTAAYICQETNICDEAGKWVIPADPAYTDYPSEYPFADGRWSPGSSSGLTYPTPTAACKDSGRPYSNPSLYEQLSPVPVNANNFNCEVKRLSDNVTLFNGSTVRTANSCPTGYTNVDGTCVFGGNTESVEPSQTQWEAAESTLNQPSSTEHVINNGGSVPADLSSPPVLENSPITIPAGTTTSTTYDNNNNATGTQTKETTITVTDGATTQQPNQVTYNETTVTNNYDLSNNLIDRTVTETSAPPPAPPEAPDIDYQFKFDDVSDNDLQDYEFPAVFSQDSWGTGSCPADRSVSYSHGNLELTYQPVCEFAEGIKPAVLVIAGLAAMFIVSGVRTE